MTAHNRAPRPWERREAQTGHTGHHHHTTIHTRRLPPYGRALRESLAGDLCQWWGTSPDGRRPSIWVVMGPDAWLWARLRYDSHLAILLAPGDDPTAYRWDVLRGYDPILLARAGDVSPAEVHALAAAMIRDGAERVVDTATGDLHQQEDAA